MKSNVGRREEGGRYFVGDDGSFGCLHRRNESGDRSERVEFEHCHGVSVSSHNDSVPRDLLILSNSAGDKFANTISTSSSPPRAPFFRQNTRSSYEKVRQIRTLGASYEKVRQMDKALSDSTTAIKEEITAIEDGAIDLNNTPARYLAFFGRLRPIVQPYTRVIGFLSRFATFLTSQMLA